MQRLLQSGASTDGYLTARIEFLHCLFLIPCASSWLCGHVSCAEKTVQRGPQWADAPFFNATRDYLGTDGGNCGAASQSVSCSNGAA